MSIAQKYKERFFYHFTHINNIPSIVEHGGLSSTNLKKKYREIAQECLNNAKVTEKNGEKTFSYQTYDLSIDDEGNIQEHKDITFNLTVTIDKDGYLKKYTDHSHIDFEYKNEITIANMQKK